ncbi:MAG: hypothetical protein D3923_14480 [Candidatus Electrothrix sp. AR3]|nr:hypothetical protein [Candidatus Electrothrix sp. AR3]
MNSSDTKLCRHSAYFQEITGADHAFQVTVDAPFVGAPFVDADCFAVSYPIKVPERPFLHRLFEQIGLGGRFKLIVVRALFIL